MEMMAADGGGPISTAANAIGGAVAQVAAESASMVAGANAMLSSAQSGGFKITADACNQWIQALDKCLDELGSLDLDLQAISQAPKLGKTHGATVIGPYTQHVATNDQSMTEAVSNSRTTINQMKAAFVRIQQSYQQTDEQNAQSFNKQG